MSDYFTTLARRAAGFTPPPIVRREESASAETAFEDVAPREVAADDASPVVATPREVPQTTAVAAPPVSPPIVEPLPLPIAPVMMPGAAIESVAPRTPRTQAEPNRVERKTRATRTSSPDNASPHVAESIVLPAEPRITATLAPRVIESPSSAIDIAVPEPHADLAERAVVVTAPPPAPPIVVERVRLEAPPTAALPLAQPAPRAATPVAETVEPDASPDVHIRIGTIELRTPAPPPAMPVSGNTRTNDRRRSSFAKGRNYRDRDWY